MLLYSFNRHRFTHFQRSTQRRIIRLASHRRVARPHRTRSTNVNQPFQKPSQTDARRSCECTALNAAFDGQNANGFRSTPKISIDARVNGSRLDLACSTSSLLSADLISPLRHRQFDVADSTSLIPHHRVDIR
ncbi:hypothetical protein [Pararobbsia silviterrae]|uniref:hypothetical protein n=1 Tax=Pararobbsia silviterrae TaxID=1792498 RepID=UPI0011C41F7B|nr:hypothetical protein [Pararobbsia silviterrae]